jgi:hypothetical protein
VATSKLHLDDQTGNIGLTVALRPEPCASFFPACATGIAPNGFLASPQTLVLPVPVSCGTHLVLMLIRD